jgi:hypothetical protein
VAESGNLEAKGKIRLPEPQLMHAAALTLTARLAVVPPPALAEAV